MTIDLDDLKREIGNLMIELWASRKETADVKESSRSLLEATRAMAQQAAAEAAAPIEGEVIEADEEPAPPLLLRQEG